MSFGGPQQLPPSPKPPYTPTRADASVVATGGGVSPRPSRLPFLSTNFTSFVGGSGGLGRKPGASKRTLIGGN